MAQQFLDHLPRVEDGALPDKAECMICREKYGTFPSDSGVIEHAVLLPCSHHVGSECIAIWLSPKMRVGNSCPLCRKVLFQPRDTDDEDEDEDDYDDESEDADEDGNEDDDESGDDEDGNGNESGKEDSENESSGEDDEDESDKEGNSDEDGEGHEGHEEAEDKADGSEQAPMTIRSAFQRLASSCSVDPSTPRELEGRDGQEWFERWPITTTQQCEASEKNARQTLSRPQPNGWLYAVPEPDLPPADLEIKVEELASAYRTMAFRETLLYLNLREAGARIRPLESPHKGLSAQEEDVLLSELGQRGAFINTHIRPEHLAMTNRQSWYVHRAKGEVYTYERSPASGRGYWSTGLDFREADVETREQCMRLGY